MMLIEELVIAWLCGLAPAFGEVPEDSPQTPFVVVERTGGEREHGLSRAVIAVQSYAPALREAAALNERVKARMADMARATPAVSAVSLNSDYNYTDTAEKRYRYQAVFVITHYSEE